MRAILQRVSQSSVEIDGKLYSEISSGLMILLGVMHGDTEKEADFLAEKCVNLRIFEDENQKMNLSLLDIHGDAMVVSNFTLCADCKKGRRPSFTESAKPDIANDLYLYFVEKLKELGISNIGIGQFAADMKVNIVNDGPVTIMLDTDEIMPNRK